MIDAASALLILCFVRGFEPMRFSHGDSWKLCD